MRMSYITALSTAMISLVTAGLAQANPNLVLWQSPEGIARLAASQHKVDFFKLANHFESQSNKLFCGPTSAAIVLNALRVRNSSLDLPQDKTLLSKQDLTHLPQKNNWSPFYQRYTQNNVLDLSPKSRSRVLGQPVIDKAGKPFKDFGLQLHQLAELFKAHQVEVNTYIVNTDSDHAALKAQMINNLGHGEDYLVVNYSRKALHQAGGGHISPLGAYDAGSDSFLILDTAPNKADWVWVDAADLLRAMATFDTVANRGFVTIKESSINHSQ